MSHRGFNLPTIFRALHLELALHGYSHVAGRCDHCQALKKSPAEEVKLFCPGVFIHGAAAADLQDDSHCPMLAAVL